MRLYILFIGVIIIALFLTGYFIIHQFNPAYTPPTFDIFAQIGEPIPPEDLGYTSMNVEQGYDIKLCGRLFIKENKIDIYVTNPTSNEVWLKVELQDANGKLLAQSGIVKQGEYVPSISLLENVTATKTNVKIIVIAYEPDTYISKGSVNMNTILYK